MDLETVMAKNAVISGQLDNAIIAIGKYETQIGELQTLNEVMESKLVEAEQNQAQMRSIMTTNITDSNAKINNYVENIQTLKATIRGMRAEIDGAVD